MYKSLALMAAIWLSNSAYARCSDYAEGFVFAYNTSVMMLDRDGSWFESNRTFTDNFSFNVQGEVDHEGTDRLLYISFFQPGDRDCSRAVVKAVQVYQFDQERYVLRCAREINGFIIGNQTPPLYQTESGDWARFRNRLYSADYEFEVLDTIVDPQLGEVLIVLMNTLSDYRCSFGAVRKDDVVLLER